MITRGSAAALVVGVVQTIPHPPRQPFPDGGQARVPPVGHGGAVHTTVGVLHTNPHPPGHPFPAGGQEKVPSGGHGGGVHTTVGVVHTIPHPPGQPFPAGGQARFPPVEQGGGVHTTVTVGAGDEGTAIADTGIPTMKSMTRNRAQENLLSILVMVCNFIKGIGLQTGSTCGFSRILSRIKTFFVKTL